MPSPEGLPSPGTDPGSPALQVGVGYWGRKWQPTPVFLPRKPLDRGAWWATVHGITIELDTIWLPNSNDLSLQLYLL